MQDRTTSLEEATCWSSSLERGKEKRRSASYEKRGGSWLWCLSSNPALESPLFSINESPLFSINADDSIINANDSKEEVGSSYLLRVVLLLSSSALDCRALYEQKTNHDVHDSSSHDEMEVSDDLVGIMKSIVQSTISKHDSHQFAHTEEPKEAKRRMSDVAMEHAHHVERTQLSEVLDANRDGDEEGGEAEGALDIHVESSRVEMMSVDDHADEANREQSNQHDSAVDNSSTASLWRRWLV